MFPYVKIDRAIADVTKSCFPKDLLKALKLGSALKVQRFVAGNHSIEDSQMRCDFFSRLLRSGSSENEHASSGALAFKKVDKFFAIR